MIKKLGTFFLLATLASCVLAQSKFDPTGTYIYKGKTVKKNGETYGYSGKIQVQKISDVKIFMTFEVNKGAPSYNSGSFVDTLRYINNESIYTCPEFDSSCKITLTFDKRGVTVKEETKDYNFGCGFGHAVVANGYFRKTSSKPPHLRRPGSGEEIK